MSEESTTPDVVELIRGTIDPLNVGDLDAGLRLFAPDAFWDMSPVGMGTLQLRYAAVRTSVDGLAVRVTNYTDIDEGRAAAERLAQERTDG